MPPVLAIVAARNEVDRIGATVDALASAFPGASIWVADDASDDDTAGVALAHGAHIVSRGRPHGKGAARPRRRSRGSSTPSVPANATSRSPPFAAG
jgi:glycosyltransferase involved in cell wall biosynthesis